MTLGTSYERISRNTFFLIDEIQRDPHWPRVLKTFFDRSDKLMFLCSGSSALNLQGNADVVGRRASVEPLYPLSFTEFELLKNKILPINGLKESVCSALYSSDPTEDKFGQLKELEPSVAQYWSQIDRLDWPYYLRFGGFPFALTRDRSSARGLVYMRL